MTEMEVFAALAKKRRTNLRMDLERPVEPGLIQELCALASWAPNHHHTWPWRFAVLTGAARADLGRYAAQGLREDGVTDEARLAKTETKYLRAPVMLIVGCSSSNRPTSQAEDFDAVAAAIQNLLLGATATGLASFWATPGTANSSQVRGLCGFTQDTEIRALVYLGWPTGEASVVQRPDPDINWIA